MKYLILFILLFIMFWVLYQLHDNSKYNINSGGCGFYALYLHKKIPNTRIVEFYNSTYSHIHVMVYDGKYYYDCKSKTKYPVWILFKHRYISKEYLQSIVYDSSWNKTFNRADTINF